MAQIKIRVRGWESIQMRAADGGEKQRIGLCCDDPMEPWVDCHNGDRKSQSCIDRFALERENAEDGLVHASQGLTSREPFQGLDAQGEFTQSE